VDVMILIIDPGDPGNPLYGMPVTVDTSDREEAGEAAILQAAAVLADGNADSPVLVRVTCQCGTAWADQPGHDGDTSGQPTCQDLTVAGVASSTWPPGTRFRPVRG
jgi:hypothetical protein